MSRFLARALALLNAAKPPTPMRQGFGGFGEIGEPGESREAAGDGYPCKVAERRLKAITEGRWHWTAPRVLGDLAAAGIDAGDYGEGGGERRMTSWAGADLTPTAGDWCSCCGRFERQGGRWWREAEAATGWRCGTCHPSPAGMAIIELAT